VIRAKAYVVDPDLISVYANGPCPYGTVPDPTPPHRPYVSCEKCALELADERCAFDRVTVGEGPKAYSTAKVRLAPRTMMKPDGQPCPRCGDNSPRGTFPWKWDVVSRVGEGPGTDGMPYQWLYFRGAR
jgi:hypothetical protein